jgi:aminopeptidase YwaD
MFKPVYKALEKEISGTIALGHVAEIAKHHRIQASPGIRVACNYAVEKLKEYGLEAELHSYPANDRDYDWTSLRFREWSCRDAWLRLVEPAKEERYLARYQEEKIHIIQRSIATPEDGVVAEVVVPANQGEEPEDYDGLDVKGKMVLTNGDVHRVHQLAVEDRGAVGIVFDGMFVRPPNLYEGELDDALKYTSYWWTPTEKPGFGFVVTPRTGRWLRRLVKKSKEPVKVHGYVDAELYEGYLDNAVATIPGESDEEVIVIAHICHPQPSANDNASGCGAVMEAARVLNKLIGEGKLTKPRRTIRFTLVPEMSGTYSYLVEREDDIPKMVAAINLDMVGEDQDKTGSVLVLHKTPDSYPSYVNAVAEAIFEEAQKEFSSIGGNLIMATYRHAVGEFSGGSDHYIYTDPTVGVGCPMLIQWPDKFYHTSADTVDKVSPHSLAKVALIAGTYAYFLACAGEKEAPWIASQVAAREKQAIIKTVQETLDKVATFDIDPRKVDEQRDWLKEKLEFDADVAIEAIKSIKRLAPGRDDTVQPLTSEMMSFVKEEYGHAVKVMEELAEEQGIKELPDFEPEAKPKPEGADKVPVRLYRGPLSNRPWVRKLSREDQEAFRALNKKHGYEFGGPVTYALYWTDGARSISEISKMIKLEIGLTNLEYLVEIYRYLQKMGVIELRDR